MCDQYSAVGKWIRPVEEALVGALDLGGASTQISFVPEGPVLDARSQATFRLYGTTHSLYAHSHLCFGRDQALLRLLVGLVQVRLPPGCGVGQRTPLALAPGPASHRETQPVLFATRATTAATGPRWPRASCTSPHACAIRRARASRRT